jgi:hypothetical protein
MTYTTLGEHLWRLRLKASVQPETWVTKKPETWVTYVCLIWLGGVGLGEGVLPRPQRFEFKAAEVDQG